MRVLVILVVVKMQSALDYLSFGRVVREWAGRSVFGRYSLLSRSSSRPKYGKCRNNILLAICEGYARHMCPNKRDMGSGLVI